MNSSSSGCCVDSQWRPYNTFFLAIFKASEQKIVTTASFDCVTCHSQLTEAGIAISILMGADVVAEESIGHLI